MKETKQTCFFKVMLCWTAISFDLISTSVVKILATLKQHSKNWSFLKY